MKAGEFRHYVVFERPAAMPDDGGGQATGYVEVGRSFAKVQPMGAFERIQAGKAAMEVSHWITVPKGDFVISNDMSIRVLTAAGALSPRSPGDRIFAIEGITDVDEAGRYYRILASEAKGRL